MHQHETTREEVSREEQDALWELLVAQVPELGQVVAYLREDHGAVHHALAQDDPAALRQAFDGLRTRYNRIGRRLPLQIQTEAQIRAWLESTDLWGDVLANREALLAGEHRGEILALLLEGRSAVPLTPEASERQVETRRPAPHRVRHAFRWMLGGLLTLGLVQSAPKAPPTPAPLAKVAAEQMAAKVLASPTPTPRPTTTPRPVASVTPTAVPTLAPELAQLIRPTIKRQEKQAKVAKPKASPTAAASAPPAPKNTPTEVPSSTPTPTPSPTAEPLTRQAEDFVTRTLTSLLAGIAPRASMDRPREGAEELVYAYLSPAAPFVALAVPHGPLQGWKAMTPPAERASVLHHVRQEVLPSGSFVLHVPGTVPDPGSFRDGEGKALSVTLEEDGAGNVRVQLSAGGAISYDLVTRAERGETYTPAPKVSHRWSEQTQQLLAQARDLPPAQAVELLRRYIEDNGTYSTNPEHFAAYARTLEQRDEHMIMDCDVAAELLAAYLEELGLRTQIQTGYQDNGDGTLVQAELHGIVRVTLPDGGVLYADATPTRFANDEERQVMAGIATQRHNPLVTAKTTLEDHRTHGTAFEEQIATLRRQLAPLSDGDRVAVYGVMLRELSADLAHLTDTQAYMYDYVYKEILYHRGAVPAYPSEVFGRITQKHASSAAALDGQLTRETPLVRMREPAEGAVHLKPRDASLPQGVFEVHDGGGQKMQFVTHLMEHPTLAPYRFESAGMYEELATGGVVATLTVLDSEGEEHQALVMGNMVLVRQKNTVYVEVFRDSAGGQHALATVEHGKGVREFFVDGKTLSLPLEPGERIQLVNMASHAPQTARVTIQRGEEDLYTLLHQGKLLRSIEGKKIMQTQREGAVIFFTYGEGEQERQGFLTQGKLVTEIVGERLVLAGTVQGRLLWITETGRWGWYEGTTPKEQGRFLLDSASGSPILTEDWLYLAEDRQAFFSEGKLVDHVMVQGKRRNIRGHVTLEGMEEVHLLYLVDKTAVVYQKGKVVLEATKDGVPLSAIYLPGASTEKALALDTLGRVHGLQLQGASLVEDHVLADGVSSMNPLSQKADANGKTYLDMKGTDDTGKMLVVDWQTKTSRIWANSGAAQPNWEEPLPGNMLPFVLHQDGSVSANALKAAKGVEETGAVLFHGKVVRPGDLLSDVAQRFFPKQLLQRNLQGSLKIASLGLVDRTDTGGGKVIFAGRLEGSPRVSFFLTSDGIQLVEGEIYEEGSGLQIWQAFFGEKGEVLYAKKLHDGLPRGMEGPQKAKAVGTPGREVLLAQASMQTIGDIRTVGGGYLLTGTFMRTDGVNVHEQQGVVFRRGEKEVVVDNIFGEETEGYVADGLHDMVAEVDAAGKLTIESTSYHPQTGSPARFVYREGVWRRVRERGAVDLAKELFALLPRGAVLRQPEAVARPEYTEDVIASLRAVIAGRGTEMTEKEASRVGAALTPAHLRAVRSMLQEPWARDFLVRYVLARSDLMLLETGTTLPELVRRMSEAELRESFTEALRTRAGEGRGW